MPTRSVRDGGARGPAAGDADRGRRRGDLRHALADLFPSAREYATHFGLGPERLRLARPEMLVMHPGPVNRGIEVSPEVADGPRSLILDQVTNGVAVRMAVLYLLPGAQRGAAGEEGRGGA